MNKIAILIQYPKGTTRKQFLQRYVCCGKIGKIPIKIPLTDVRYACGKPNHWFVKWEQK